MFDLLRDIWATRTRVCQCGHDRIGHEHYRSGTDCALCDCARYRRAADDDDLAVPSKQPSMTAV